MNPTTVIPTEVEESPPQGAPRKTIVPPNSPLGSRLSFRHPNPLPPLRPTTVIPTEVEESPPQGRPPSFGHPNPLPLIRPTTVIPTEVEEPPPQGRPRHLFPVCC